MIFHLPTIQQSQIFYIQILSKNKQQILQVIAENVRQLAVNCDITQKIPAQL
jgi:hypothetical protein